MCRFRVSALVTARRPSSRFHPAFFVPVADFVADLVVVFAVDALAPVAPLLAAEPVVEGAVEEAVVEDEDAGGGSHALGFAEISAGTMPWMR